MTARLTAVCLASRLRQIFGFARSTKCQKRNPRRKRGPLPQLAARPPSLARREAVEPQLPRKIQLKPIKVLIDRTISNLQKLQPTEATETTIKHLQMCSMTLADICDPNTPGGCGPHMEFDFPLALTKFQG